MQSIRRLVMSKINEILDALIIVDANSEALFHKMRWDIDRGDIASARKELTFVDMLIEARKKEVTDGEK